VLERRLVMIMKGRVPVRLSWMGFSIVALMAVATLPAWATGPQANPPTPPPTIPTQSAPVVVEKKAEKPKDVRVAVVQTPVKPKPEVRVLEVKPEIIRNYTVSVKQRRDLPADGEELLKGYEADRKAFEEELDKKVAARRAVLEKAFNDLQEKYTKAGKLDEAVAIRDFIKAGMPGIENRYRLSIKK
jgi:hypothetical protein